MPAFSPRPSTDAGLTPAAAPDCAAAHRVGGVLSAWICLLSGRVAAQPYVPAEDAIVLERVPVTSGSERAELRALRAELTKNPHDVGLATRLAKRYVEVGRAEYDRVTTATRRRP